MTKNQKWFYPLQTKATQWLDQNFARWQSDWQDVVDREGIVYERFSGIDNNNQHSAVIITLLKQSNDIFIYRLIN